MTPTWNDQFRSRMSRFAEMRCAGPGEMSVSIKIRVTSGCFHREHSPYAYELIDADLDALSDEDYCFELVEHESGPELLVIVAATTAAITLAKSVVDLLVAIIKARTEGVKHGDRPASPIEIIVRRTQSGGEYREERIVRIGHRDAVDVDEIEGLLKRGLEKLCENPEEIGSEES